MSGLVTWLLLKLLLIHDLVLHTLEGELNIPALKGETSAGLPIRIVVAEAVANRKSCDKPYQWRLEVGCETRDGAVRVVLVETSWEGDDGTFDGLMKCESSRIAYSTIEDDSDLATLRVGVNMVKLLNGTEKQIRLSFSKKKLIFDHR